MMRAPMIAGAVVLLGGSPAQAFVPRAGGSVTFAEQLRDDLYAAGGTVEIRGEVDGDATVAGGTVSLGGTVTGGVLAGAGTLRLGGTVGRSVRAGGGTVYLQARVGTDAILTGGSVEVDPQAQIGRDLVAAGGSVSLSGTVGRNALLSGGEVVISGTVGGDVEVRAERVTLLPTARIQGRLRYRAERPAEIQPGAQTAGGVEQLPFERGRRRGMLPSFPFAGRAVELLWLVVLGAVILAVAPRGSRLVVDRVAGDFGISLLTGFVLCIVVPVAVLIVLVTVVGIPLALVALLLYLATLYPSLVFAVQWFGEVLLRPLRRGDMPPSPFLSLLVGALIMVILMTIPFVGWLVRLAAMLVGFGALWTTVWKARRGRSVPAGFVPSGG